MFDHQEPSVVRPEETAPLPSPAVPVEPEPAPSPNGHVEERWQARAGREGARRIHQLIEEGRLYEKEHGLTRGRQRLRQLIELGKRYEQEHGLRPAHAPKRGRRLSRLGRHELMTTLLQCLERIARPSFRNELSRLAEALERETNSHVA